jgi:2-polyprenyl-6-methoxyphenol hydroxylase-like FAD-dependent oxidoreductase
VLVGDAAHAMAPNLGQGANSAMVDAAVLAHELSTSDVGASRAGDGALATALTRYDARRRPAVRAVQDTAARLMRVSDWRQPVARSVRDAALCLVSHLPGMSERGIRAAQQEPPAWLYETAQRYAPAAGTGSPGAPARTDTAGATGATGTAAGAGTVAP